MSSQWPLKVTGTGGDDHLDGDNGAERFVYFVEEQNPQISCEDVKAVRDEKIPC